MFTKEIDYIILDGNKIELDEQKVFYSSHEVNYD
jgi:hypothetical protein